MSGQLFALLQATMVDYSHHQFNQFISAYLSHQTSHNGATMYSTTASHFGLAYLYNYIKSTMLSESAYARLFKLELFTTPF